MAIFDHTPLERYQNDLKYFWDCCVVKKKREERYKEIFKEVEPCKHLHCQYWFTSEEMRRKYKDHRKKYTILPAELRYAYDIYLRFEKDFGFREHEEWCMYDIHEDKLRDGVKKLGTTLHVLCHNPIDLIYNRAVGLRIFQKRKHKKEEKKDLKEQTEEDFLKNIKEEFTDVKKECDAKKQCEVEELEKELQNVMEQLEKENQDTQEGRHILREQQFLSDYFEILSLKNILSEEIKLREGQTGTLKGWMAVFVSLLVADFGIVISKDDFIFPPKEFPPPLTDSLIYIISIIVFIALVVTVIWHMWVSIKLNEAKDVMYLCLGVDYDHPRDRIVCD